MVQVEWRREADGSGEVAYYDGFVGALVELGSWQDIDGARWTLRVGVYLGARWEDPPSWCEPSEKGWAKSVSEAQRAAEAALDDVIADTCRATSALAEYAAPERLEGENFARHCIGTLMLGERRQEDPGHAAA